MSIRTFQEHTPALGERVFVDPSAVLIGDIEIGEDSSVWPLTVIRGDMHRIRKVTPRALHCGARLGRADGRAHWLRHQRRGHWLRHQRHRAVFL